MTRSHKRLATAAAIGASELAVTGIAGAATKHTTKTTTTRTASGTTGATGAGAHNETVLTGDTLKSASDAAIAANADAKVTRASTEDPAEGSGAAYEVKITKADGTRAEVLEDSAFKVLSTKADTGHRGHGGHGANPNEPALTGTDLTKATSAAEAAVSGGTVERASKDDASEGTNAAFEVHVTKTDGSHVTVLLDSSFAVVKTVADTGHGHHR